MHTKQPHRTDLDRDLERLGLTREKLAAAAELSVDEINFSAAELELPENGPDGETPSAPPMGLTTTPKPEIAAASATGTIHTTIRVPAGLLAAYKAKAAELRIGYQTLIIRTLREAAGAL
jgi:hypothetical protein